MYLKQEEKDYLRSLGARIVGNEVYDQSNNLASDDDLKSILDDARKKGLIGGTGGSDSKNKPVKGEVLDADFRYVDEDSDDSESGYQNQRQYRKARGSNRTNVHRSGYSAPQTRSETSDVDMGYIPTARENRTALSKLRRDQKAAAKEEKGQKQRKIRQYATNEMKYPGRISFFNGKSAGKTQQKHWCAIDCNRKTGKGLTVEVCSTKEEAMKHAEKMRAKHSDSSSFAQKVAYTEPSNIKCNGSFKKRPANVYTIESVVR